MRRRAVWKVFALKRSKMKRKDGKQSVNRQVDFEKRNAPLTNWWEAVCVCVMHYKRAHTRIHSDTHAHAEAGRRLSLFEEGIFLLLSLLLQLLFRRPAMLFLCGWRGMRFVNIETGNDPRPPLNPPNWPSQRPANTVTKCQVEEWGGRMEKCCP